MKTIAQQLNIKKFPFTINDSHGNLLYFEDSTGTWMKREYDSRGNLVYIEDSIGRIVDIRPKQVELTMDQIAEKFGIDVSQLKIKK